MEFCVKDLYTILGTAAARNAIQCRNFTIFLDNLIASSQNLMGSNEGVQQYPSSSDYQMAPGKTKITMKSRRGRTSFTQAQLSDLEAAFSNTHYPDFQTRKELSNRLKIPDDRIQVS
jgi:hypothetical protein